MREIKFRAWNSANKLMAYAVQNEYDTIAGVRYWKDGKELDAEPGESSFGDYLGRDIYVVMQFTGLKDKNGKEIYEGDICTYQAASYSDEKIINIEYSNKHAAFVMIGLEKWPCIFVCTKFDKAEWNEIITVIGNIYENPELIERGM